MTTTRNELPPVSWDDLLAAISPRRGLAGDDLRRVIEAIVAAQQGGQITEEEAEEIIKALLAVAMSGQVNALVNDFFTPDVYGRLGGHLGNRGFGLQGSRRFSLL